MRLTDFLSVIKATQLKDRLVFPLLTAALFMLAIPVFILERRSFAEMERQRLRLREVTALSYEYSMLRERIGGFEKRQSITKTEGIIQAVDSVVTSAGVKRRVKSVKTTGSREIAGGSEEGAEVSLERLNMNELVNMLYRAENPVVMLSLKQVIIKKSFEKPDLLDASITLSLFRMK